MSALEDTQKLEKRDNDRNHNLNELFVMMREFGAKFEAHMKHEEASMRAHTTAINALAARMEEVAEVHYAFPKDEDGERDFKGHRHYHTKLMGEAKEQGQFWANRKDEIGKMALYGLMMLCILGVNTYITQQSTHPAAAVAAK